MHSWWIDTSIIIKCPLSLVIIFALKCILSDMNTAISLMLINNYVWETLLYSVLQRDTFVGFEINLTIHF